MRNTFDENVTFIDRVDINNAIKSYNNIIMTL